MFTNDSTPASLTSAAPTDPDRPSVRNQTGTGHRIRRSVAGALLFTGVAFFAVGCSADDADTVYSETTDLGPADTSHDDVDVDDGTEGGLDLDNGNVENSTNDDDLDPFDEENDLNTDEFEAESDPSNQ